ncbi:hypothetical protein GCM10011572_22350 [Pseudoduganella buxea]|uniref:Transposase n=1 Tax=Pseudoduganella buxea TaxID=1949069 RepID=A0ABQ1KI72_9BURK|nr:hypothetical protein GCM10011572_22350 [Pseudoduganella buxea]
MGTGSPTPAQAASMAHDNPSIVRLCIATLPLSWFPFPDDNRCGGRKQRIVWRIDPVFPQAMAETP